MFQPNIPLANFLLAQYPDEYPAGWYLVLKAGEEVPSRFQVIWERLMFFA